jgi:hypothetical protein
MTVGDHAMSIFRTIRILATATTRAVLSSYRNLLPAMCVGLIVTIMTPGALLADEGELAAEVKRLVAGLNANSLSQRAAAEQAIIALGPKALELLPEVTDKTPPEVAQRLLRARQTLEQAQATAAAQSTLVTLIGEDLPLIDVLTRISQQTENKLVDYRGEIGEEATEPRLSLNLEKVPFWTALDQVLDKADLRTYDYVGGRGVYLVNRPSTYRSRTVGVSYAGPFRIEATRLEAVRDLQNPQRTSLRLFMGVAWEPRLMPLAIQQAMADITAVGDNGAPLKVTAGGVNELNLSEDSSAAELQVPLELPPRSMTKIASLKGKFTVLMAGPPHAFKFSSLPVVGQPGQPKQKVEKLEQRRAAVTVAVDEVRRNHELWEVRTRVRYDEPGDALESYRTWLLSNEVWLETADGQRFTPEAFEQTRQAANESGMAYLFDLADSPETMTFVYRTPTNVYRFPVEYELKDLELP